MDGVLQENEANAANFKELVGHINIANNRLKQMIPSSETHAQTLQEMQDYYERAIQDRQMRIATLTEHFAERERDLGADKTVLVRACCALVASIVTTAVVLAPDEVNAAMLVCAPYLTPDRLAGYALTATIAYGCGAR